MNNYNDDAGVEWDGPDYEAAKQAAIRWAQDVLTTDFVVLDTETTGLDEQAEAVSIALINRNGQSLLNCLLKPHRDIPAAATAIHGITNEDVAGALSIFDILPLLYTLTYTRPVLIYNADYDLRVLRQTLGFDYLGGIFDPRQVGCVMERFAEYFGEWDDYHGSYRWQKLTAAAQYFGIDTAGAHGALADCRMTLAVVKAMAVNTPVSEADDPAEYWPEPEQPPITGMMLGSGR